MKTTLFIFLFTANLGWADSHNLNAMKTPAESNSKKVVCLFEGQKGFVAGVPGLKGWTLDPPCCAGLKGREPLSVCGKAFDGGYAYVCVTSSDLKCDARYESICNCPEDRKMQLISKMRI